MFTVACCLVVGLQRGLLDLRSELTLLLLLGLELGLGLGLDLDHLVSGW